MEGRHWVVGILAGVVIGFILMKGGGSDEYSIQVRNETDNSVLIALYQDGRMLCRDEIRSVDYCKWGEHDGNTHRYRAIVTYQNGGEEAKDLTTDSRTMQLRVNSFLTTFQAS